MEKEEERKEKKNVSVKNEGKKNVYHQWDCMHATNVLYTIHLFIIRVRNHDVQKLNERS